MKNIHQLLGDFRELLLAFWGVKYGILKKIGNSSISWKSLSTASTLPADRFHRLLRGLIWRKIIDIKADGQVSLTETGLHYLEESELILFQGEFFLRQWTFFDKYFEEGLNPYISSQGKPIFQAIQEDKRLGRIFASPWSDRTSEYSTQIARLPLFSEMTSIVDVGGAEGQLLHDLLSVHHHLNGIVFDLPYCRPSFNSRKFEHSDRIKFEEGSFFDDIPQGADAYLLKWILHDWDDDNSITILNNCKKAMHPKARLLIIERIVPDDLEKSINLAQADLNMLALNCGKERTEDEMADLLDQSGLTLNGRYDFENNYGFSVIQASLNN